MFCATGLEKILNPDYSLCRGREAIEILEWHAPLSHTVWGPLLLSGLIRHTPIRHETRIRIRIRIYANIRGVSVGAVGPETLDALRNAR